MSYNLEGSPVMVRAPGSDDPWNLDRRAPATAKAHHSACLAADHSTLTQLEIQIRTGTRVRVRLGTPKLAPVGAPRDVKAAGLGNGQGRPGLLEIISLVGIRFP
jgi:hypothetical protein